VVVGGCVLRVRVDRFPQAGDGLVQAALLDQVPTHSRAQLGADIEVAERDLGSSSNRIHRLKNRHHLAMITLVNTF
jgi:hypothetical protein